MAGGGGRVLDRAKANSGLYRELDDRQMISKLLEYGYAGLMPTLVFLCLKDVLLVLGMSSSKGSV